MSIVFSIVSLKKDKERREQIIKELNDVNIKANVIDAVNGKSLPAIDYFENMQCVNSKIKGRKILTPSELGCYLSHKKVLEDFIESNEDVLVVLEDDVSLVNKNISSDITDIENFVISHNSIFILGGQDGLNSFRRVILNKESSALPFLKVFKPTSRFIYRTCSYMLNRVVALEILSLMNNISFFIDDWNLIMKKTCVDSLYYTYWFSHPIDISGSTIEAERKKF